MAPDDLDAVVGVWERSRWDAQPWLEQRMGHSHEDSRKHFAEVVARENDVWLAYERTAIIALLALHNGQIDQLYVDPPWQGRGVGSALLEKAQQLSPSGLVLFTHQRNERARAFYERRGFAAVAFGVSPAPESEPDVKYAWQPQSGGQL